MFKIDHRDGPWPLTDLIDIDSDSIATVAPTRGGLVARWKARGRDMLFLDESTFNDASKNVRGGIPVLFPSPGKLSDDRWRQGERGGSLPQHGFARQQPWRVVDEGTGGEASVTLALPFGTWRLYYGSTSGSTSTALPSSSGTVGTLTPISAGAVNAITSTTSSITFDPRMVPAS